MNSSNLKQRRIGILNIVLMCGYLLILLNFSSDTWAIILYISISIFLASLCYLINKNSKQINQNIIKFKRNSPFSEYGYELHKFQYFYTQNTDIRDNIFFTLQKNLIENSTFSNFKELKVIDRDRNLIKVDTRSFFKSSSEKTARNSEVVIIILLDKIQNIYHIEWWFLVNGSIRLKNLLNFILLSPLNLPFWIIPYLRGDFNIYNHLKSRYQSFYDDIDIIKNVLGVHKLLIKNLISELKEHNVDVSDLEQQFMQNNLKIVADRGSVLKFGNIIQNFKRHI